MELECAKYGERMDAAQAACRHPGDYCQYRQACMIQFAERENRGEKAADERLALAKEREQKQLKETRARAARERCCNDL